MVERSRPWSGIVTGDAGPYSDDQWTDVWKTTVAPVIASAGVFVDQLNDLALGGLPASPVTIDTGRALVNGIWYESDASVSVAIPTPGANPRVDRIVLRADWVLQTVRITRIAGAEAASPVPPAIVQIDGTTWDLPLHQVNITVGGVITVHSDDREFLGQYEPSAINTQRVYWENDWFFGGIPTNGDNVAGFDAILVGAGLITNVDEAGFGAGGVEFNMGGGGVGDAGVELRGFRPDQIDARLIVRCKNPNTDATLDRFRGFSDTFADLTPTNGLFFRSDGVGNWFAVARAAGVEVAVDTTIAPDNVWREFEIRVTGTSLAQFLIDGVVRATHKTNIPSVNLGLLYEIFDDGVGFPALAEYMQIDWERVTGDR